jgi:hypothetical protein
MIMLSKPPDVICSVNFDETYTNSFAIAVRLYFLLDFTSHIRIEVIQPRIFIF